MGHARNGGTICTSRILPGEFIRRKFNSICTCLQVPPQDLVCCTSNFGCNFHSVNFPSSNLDDDDRNQNSRQNIEQERFSVYVIAKTQWIFQEAETRQLHVCSPKFGTSTKEEEEIHFEVNGTI